MLFLFRRSSTSSTAENKPHAKILGHSQWLTNGVRFTKLKTHLIPKLALSTGGEPACRGSLCRRGRCDSERRG